MTSPLAQQECLSQQVSRLLLAEIRSGIFQPGDRLPTEAELAKQYGISRTVLREALASLKNDGILDSKQGRGILINDPDERQAFRFSDVFETISRAEVQHLYEMRAILEAEAAGLAALRHTPDDLQAIKKAFGAMDRAVEASQSGEEAHLRYNEAIGKASHNPVLSEFLTFLLGRLRSLSRELRLSTMIDPARARLVLAEHRSILEGITSRDPQQAREATLIHLRNAAQRAGLEIYAP
ncbi:MAG: FadR/GntR family transcriptional regulator [Synergistales bacterium]|nr:FadR/GntR family transcriptional regulator [Synergistales bacterium]